MVTDKVNVVVKLNSESYDMLVSFVDKAMADQFCDELNKDEIISYHEVWELPVITEAPKRLTIYGASVDRSGRVARRWEETLWDYELTEDKMRQKPSWFPIYFWGRSMSSSDDAVRLAKEHRWSSLAALNKQA